MKTIRLPNRRGLRRPALAAALLLIGFVGTAWRAAAPPRVFGASSAAYPLKVSANGRYLVDQNDKPFLITGDNPHALIGMGSVADAESYFADRQAHGFNAVWMNLLVATPAAYDSQDDASTPDGIRPFTGFIGGGTDAAHYDLTKPNEAYFARVDEMMQAAANHGLVVFLDPIDTCCKAAPARTLWLRAMLANGIASTTAYGKYVGERYRRFNNIVWLNGDDFNTWRTPADDAAVLSVAKAIKAADPTALQTVELNIFTSSSLDDPAWAPIISFNSTYSYSPTYIQMLHSYDQTPRMPTYLVEGHYDLERVGDPTDYGTPEVLRRQGYWTMLSGGTGQLYGNAYIWPFLPGWRFYIDTVGVTQLTIWKDFFTSLPWQDLVPDQDHRAVTAGLGTFGDPQVRVSKSDYCTAARTPDGSFLVAYMPTMRTITVNMASLKAPATAQWFDPTNGSYAPVLGGPFANRGELQFTPPGKNREGAGDWVLMLAAGASE